MRIIILHEKHGDRAILFDKSDEERVATIIAEERKEAYFYSQINYVNKSNWQILQIRNKLGYEYETFTIMEVEDL